MKKLLITFVLLFSFYSYSDPCQFTAKVIPEERTEQVKGIYEEMCEWYHATFPDYPLDPEIPLNEVRFVSDWKEIECVTKTDANESLNALYNKIHDKEINEIVVLYPSQNLYWVKSPKWIDSVLAHKIFHYFTKACCAELLKKVEDINIALFESFAYWAQDQFLKRNFDWLQGYTRYRTLADLVKNKEDIDDMKYVDNFQKVAYFLYGMAMGKFIYNSPLFVEKVGPQKFFDNLVNGLYIMNEYRY